MMRNVIDKNDEMMNGIKSMGMIIEISGNENLENKLEESNKKIDKLEKDKNIQFNNKRVTAKNKK